MATLILTAVGTAVGGPIGGALGAMLGQRLDQSLLGPKLRQGPRLGDLAVQTSSYGSPLPKLFGRMRIAGTVIWATDLIETRSTSGGKGQPKTANYTYAANFAVALSARPIRRISRIWADGKLVRGAAGDFKTPTTFRMHFGDEDQVIDPLIASALGITETPAFRGLAYAVFENFQLADYGNRIPSLSFEIEADDEPVAIGEIAEALSAAAILGGLSPSLVGYAASGDSLRGALEPLAKVVGLSLRDDGSALRLVQPDEDPVDITHDEESGRRELMRRAMHTGETSIAYYDPDRDFQNGLQRATAGHFARETEQVGLPAALSAAAAKALAEGRLAAIRAERMQAKVRLGWARADLRPGQIISLQGAVGRWVARRCRVGPMSIEIDLEQLALKHAIPPLAEAGQSAEQPDLIHGPTTLALIDAPIGAPVDGKPLLFVAAAGSAPGWRRASLLVSFDGGARWTDAGATALPATMGVAVNVLPASQSQIFDTATSVEIDLLSDGMELENASDAALLAGAGLAMLGDELIQFGRATMLGVRRWRLSRLLRGRRGTEWAMNTHAVGESFVLIEPETLAQVPVPAGSIGGTIQVSAAGVDDSSPVAINRQIRGESLLPPSPVGLAAVRRSSGDIAISWTRRSRVGWAWTDVETPLGEERESYQIAITGDGFQRVMESGSPAFLYDMAMQAADGASEALVVAVRQAGDHGLSYPATLLID